MATPYRRLLLALLSGSLATAALGAQCRVFVGRAGGSGSDHAFGVLVHPISGALFAAGGTDSHGRGEDLWVARFDAAGVPLGSAAWGGAGTDSVGGMALHGGTAGSGIYLSGESDSFGAGDLDVVLVRYDLSGSLQWGITWATPVDEHADDVVLDAAGNAYLAGGIQVGGADDVLLLKFAPGAGGAPPGPPVAATWGGLDADSINGAALDASLGPVRLVVAGNTRSHGNGDADVLLQSYDDNLNLLWTRTWGGAFKDDGEGVTVDAAGNIYVVGATQPAPGAPDDALVMKWSAAGSLQWYVVFGGSGEDSVGGVRVDPFGNVFASGATTSFGAGMSDGLLLKLDADGNLLWAQTWGGGQDDGLGRVEVLAGGDWVVPGIGDGAHVLVPVTGAGFTRSNSPALVGSPAAPVGPVPTGSLAARSASPGTAPGPAQGVDTWIMRHVGAFHTLLATCPAGLHSCGGPVLEIGNAPTIGAPFRVRRRSICGVPLSVLVVGLPAAPLPLSTYGSTVPGAALCVNPAVAEFRVGGTLTEIVIPLPFSPLLCRTTFDVQWGDLLSSTEIGTSAPSRFVIGL